MRRPGVAHRHREEVSEVKAKYHPIVHYLFATFLVAYPLWLPRLYEAVMWWRVP